MIVMGDVDDDVVDGLVRSVRASSATLLGELRIDPLVMDPDQAQRVAEVMGVQPSEDIVPMEVFGARLAEIVPGIVSAVAGAEVPSGSAVGLAPAPSRSGRSSR